MLLIIEVLLVIMGLILAISTDNLAYASLGLFLFLVGISGHFFYSIVTIDDRNKIPNFIIDFARRNKNRLSNNVVNDSRKISQKVENNIIEYDVFSRHNRIPQVKHFPELLNKYKKYFFLSGNLHPDAIQLFLGELGHQIIDHPEIVAGFEELVDKFGTEINFIHGPLVDPKTVNLYKLSKKEKIKLNKLDKYHADHYILITYNDGTTTVLDEGVHDETIWENDSSAPILDNLFKSVFVYSENEKPRRVKLLKKHFKRMQTKSKPSPEKPIFTANDNVSSLRFLMNSFWNGIIRTHYIQPLLIKYDIWIR